MTFIKYFINKHGIFIGAGSLAVMIIGLILAVYITRGIILIVVPVIAFGFVLQEFFSYQWDKKYKK